MTEILNEFGIETEVCILSAHRTPMEMMEYAKKAESENIKVIIAGAGGAAHLPGMIASLTCIPVIGVPVESKTLRGIDSLLSIVQMPAGIPVATVAINGAKNAGLLAIQILSLFDEALRVRMKKFRDNLHTQSVSAYRDLRGWYSTPNIRRYSYRFPRSDHLWRQVGSRK